VPEEGVLVAQVLTGAGVAVEVGLGVGVAVAVGPGVGVSVGVAVGLGVGFPFEYTGVADMKDIMTNNTNIYDKILFSFILIFLLTYL